MPPIEIEKPLRVVLELDSESRAWLTRTAVLKHVALHTLIEDIIKTEAGVLEEDMRPVTGGMQDMTARLHNFLQALRFLREDIQHKEGALSPDTETHLQAIAMEGGTLFENLASIAFKGKEFTY